MEEIVTVDGRQFKLTTDRPLTSLEKSQAIADIRRQSGCSGGCGQRAMEGSIYGMAPSCTATPKGTTDTITLAAAPMVGTAPYRATFMKAPAGSVLTDGSDATNIPIGRLTGITSNPTPKNIPEAVNSATPTVTATYTLDDVDVAGATVKGVDVLASIIFRLDIDDSCPTGAATCSEICKVFVTCPAPTCNFIVT